MDFSENADENSLNKTILLNSALNLKLNPKKYPRR